MKALKRISSRFSASRAQSPLARAMQITGQLSTAEAKALHSLGLQVRSGNEIVEIGSYRGRSTIILGLAARERGGVHVYAVDPHLEYVGPKGGVYGPPDQAALYSNISQFALGETIFVVSLPSADVGRVWSSRPIGLLWIDGDHRYEGVKADIESWYPHIVADGIIAFHDSDFPGVAQACREAVENGMMSFVGTIDSLSWYRKRGGDNHS